MVGKAEPEPVGGLDYLKRRERHFEFVTVTVTVYRNGDPVQLDTWKEQRQRHSE